MKGKKIERAYIGIRSVHHNAIECDPLLCKAKSKLDMLRIRSMVEVNCDWYRSAVGTEEERSGRDKIKTIETHTLRQN